MPTPEVVVDNTARDERIRRKAIRRLNKDKPDHTYDDVLAEVENIKKEEAEDGK